jgi:4-hydroxy-2-oxoheptanedioate aldolase
VAFRGLLIAGLVSLYPVLAHAQRGAAAEVYNTVMQKLAAGQQVVGGTVMSPDPEIYCAMANSGFDFLWIEMQHSPLSYQDVAPR